MLKIFVNFSFNLKTFFMEVQVAMVKNYCEEKLLLESCSTNFIKNVFVKHLLYFL